MYPGEGLGGLTAAKEACRLQVFCVAPALPNSLRKGRQDLSCHVSFSFLDENKERNIGCWRGGG